MFIKGGNAVWGNQTHAPDDLPETTHSFGELFSIRTPVLPPAQDASDVDGQETDQGAKLNIFNMTADESAEWVLRHSPKSWQVGMKFDYRSCRYANI